MQEFTENTNERVSANPSNQIKSDLAESQPISGPEGSATTAFQKFAAGATFATPSGPAKAPPLQKKRGRRRKYAPKKLLNADQPGTSGAVNETPVPAAPLAQPSKPAEFFEYTGPFLGMLSQIPAAKLKDKRWALTKEESVQLGKALDPVINVFLPDLEKMDPKTAAILGFAIVAASIYHKKAVEIELAAAPPVPAASPTANEPKIESAVA